MNYTNLREFSKFSISAQNQFSFFFFLELLWTYIRFISSISRFIKLIIKLYELLFEYFKTEGERKAMRRDTV